jgi:hypothetical protein
MISGVTLRFLASEADLGDGLSVVARIVEGRRDGIAYETERFGDHRRPSSERATAISAQDRPSDRRASTRRTRSISRA